MQQGAYVAKLIRNRIRGRSQRPFVYTDRGSMAVIGRAAAVAQIGRAKVHGIGAWLIWLFVHLMYLVEFENRILVLIQWGWNYVTRNRSARLITNSAREGPYNQSEKSREAEKQQVKCYVTPCRERQQIRQD
jgi:NADH dehydrogenase